jgi:hypothetical protein
MNDDEGNVFKGILIGLPITMLGWLVILAIAVSL